MLDSDTLFKIFFFFVETFRSQVLYNGNERGEERRQKKTVHEFQKKIVIMDTNYD